MSIRKRDKDFHKAFKEVPQDEVLLRDYACAYQKEILLQGRIYLTVNLLCFRANILGYVHKIVVPLQDMTVVAKQKTAYIIPNAIEITTEHKKYFFTTFNSRNRTFKDILRIWQNNLLGKPTSQAELLLELNTSHTLEKNVKSDQNSLANSNNTGSSDTEVVTKDTVIQDGGVKHFALSVDDDYQKEIDETFTDESVEQEIADYHSATNVSALLQEEWGYNSSNLSNDSANRTHSSECSSSSETVVYRKGDILDERSQPIACLDLKRQKGKEVFEFLIKKANILKNLCPQPVFFFNLLMIMLALVLLLTTVTLVCHLSDVDPMFHNLLPWQPWCQYFCRSN